LALIATLFLPVWERQLVPSRLADLVRAYRAYLTVLADPHSSVDDRQAARAQSRLARTNAQASVERARVDLVTQGPAVDLGESVLANSHRVVHALMTFDSVRVSMHDAAGLAELDDLLRDAGRALDAAETALRSASPPRGATNLRPEQERLHARLVAAPERVGGAEIAGALADASDRLANAVDTLLDELRGQLDSRPAVTSQR
jgi:uncharacterized membrane protein YccC